MTNVIPSSAPPVGNRALDAIRVGANADGEVFGGELMNAMRDAGSAFGVDRLGTSADQDCACEGKWSLSKRE